jgi:hypothetical protein
MPRRRRRKLDAPTDEEPVRGNEEGLSPVKHEWVGASTLQLFGVRDQSLHKCASGEISLTRNQLWAAEILLRKCVPDRDRRDALLLAERLKREV